MKASLCFLFHMHQPYYRDLITNTFEMPWVRLHAVKGYYDIPSIIRKFKTIQVTVNLVPSLIEQISVYNSGQFKDRYLELSKKDPDAMSEDEKLFVVENFFAVNKDRNIAGSRRYTDLLKKRTDTRSADFLKKRLTLFSKKDIKDLQALFNLHWFGFTALEEYPELKVLKLKDRDFSRNDINRIIDIQFEIIKKILPLYRDMAKDGRIELTVSPYYHPILPLLYSTDTAKRCMPAAELPVVYNSPESAKNQICKAVEYFKEQFGYNVQGMWPSEGSVSPEVLEMMIKSGIKWVATDEEILKYSGYESAHRNTYLYKPYIFNKDSESIKVIFRDKKLSDMVGFECHRVDSKTGVGLLCNEIKHIINSPDSENKMITIVLDGENPWEYYENSGKDFLIDLFKQLESSKELNVDTVSQGLKKICNPPELKSIHSGSWINADFGIWIGHHETNKAWSVLKRAHTFFEKERKSGKHSKDVIKTAEKELAIAQGSDWFWWYGDDFNVQGQERFDRLFRMHLSNIYHLLGKETPFFMNVPIKQKSEESLVIQKPLSIIEPLVNGRQAHFFEWSGSGYAEIRGKGASMYTGSEKIKRILFGCDKSNLFLRLIFFENIRHYWLTLKLMDSKMISFTVQIQEGHFQASPLKEGSSGEKKEIPVNADFVFHDVLDCKIPLSPLGFLDREPIELAVELLVDNTIVSRIPSRDFLDTGITLPVNKSDFWWV